MLVYRSYAESFPATVVTKYKGGVLVSNAKDERFYIKCCLRPGTCVWCTLVKKDARFDYPLALLDSVEYAVA